mmetsp:Transcript_9801/g.8330  ORF Transcript_9801/g.8330 Transcript_9801/m.8330 type:complete len:143 (-) Transcript_9801:114-542(-)
MRLPIGTGNPIPISQEMLEKWRQLIIQQILVAGSRTAIILNDILESSAAPGLRSGSIVTAPAGNDIEIDDVMLDDHSARRPRKLDTKTDIMLQLTIMAVVVVIGLGAYLAFTFVSKRKSASGESGGGIRLPTVVQSKKEMID